MRVMTVLLMTAMLPVAASVAAPNQSKVESYRALVALDKRLASTGYRLAKANAPFCADTWRNPGWVLHSYRQYGDRAAARAAFPFRTAVSIAALVDGGPAAKAGLAIGDGVYHLEGPISFGADRRKHKPNNETLKFVEDSLRALLGLSRPIALGFETESGPRDFTLDPPTVCASFFLVSTGRKADAGADGETVRVSAKLAEFTPDEDEFAFVAAHEMAHNILRHRTQLDAAKARRGSGRRFGKSKKLIRQGEVEADRLAIWLMANAGYDPAAALTFIERWGRKYGGGIFAAGTHYKWKKRREIMRAEIAILAQAERGPDGYPLPLDSMGLSVEAAK